MNKTKLRSSFLNKRKMLSPQEVTSQSNLISKRFFDKINLENIDCIHCFLPITKNNEINTVPIIEELWLRKKQVVVPVSNFFTHEMEAAILTSNTILTVKKGITEPKSPTLKKDKKIDLIILPLAIFDHKGFRIGYGGGFYDRYIQQLPHKPILIGVSFFDAIDDIYPTEFDVPLDYCLTPSNTYFFN
jgi:5-formyltetrahydrofolate cyclo-ligase